KGCWREVAGWAARVLLPELVALVLVRELYALGLGLPGEKTGDEGLCGVCRRCKF
ncbi:transposase, partial [Thermus scotoductus]